MWRKIIGLAAMAVGVLILLWTYSNRRRDLGQHEVIAYLLFVPAGAAISTGIYLLVS